MSENMEDRFLPIRHYNEREARFVWTYLIENEEFRKSLHWIEDKVSLQQLDEEFSHFQSVYDFQLSVEKRFMDVFIEKSISKMNFSGIENLDDDKAYLFLANHRDIVMDTALLQQYFFLNHKRTSKIAFGNNLISSPVLDALAKLNKMFIVKRDGTIREKLANSKLLSEYIRYSLLVEKESVWIAQRNGRTKDGIDKTQQGLLKMLSESSSDELVQAIKELNIVPITVSYEFEPCDQLKARELALSENGPYVKRDGEDFASMRQGVFDYKGEVSLVIGKPFVNEFDNIDVSLKNNDKIRQISQLIDERIFSNYQLFANNFVAYELMTGDKRFSDKYSEQQKTDFVTYLEKQSVVADVPAGKMREYLLKIYANPVKSFYGFSCDEQ